MKLPPLTTKAIRAWVEALPADEAVGRRHDPQACLVAEYIGNALLGTAPHYFVNVGTTLIQVETFEKDWSRIETYRRRPSEAVRRIILDFDALPQQMPLPADVLPIFDKETRHD